VWLVSGAVRERKEKKIGKERTGKRVHVISEFRRNKKIYKRI